MSFFDAHPILCTLTILVVTILGIAWFGLREAHRSERGLGVEENRGRKLRDTRDNLGNYFFNKINDLLVSPKFAHLYLSRITDAAGIYHIEVGFRNTRTAILKLALWVNNGEVAIAVSHDPFDRNYDWTDTPPEQLCRSVIRHIEQYARVNKVA